MFVLREVFFVLVLLCGVFVSLRLSARPLSQWRCGVFVVSSNSSSSASERRFFHVRQQFATGPFAVSRVSCGSAASDSVSAKEKTVVCAHRQAYAAALSAGLDCALVVEDDAQTVPRFWEHLHRRLEAAASLQLEEFVLWLDFMVLNVSDFGRIWMQGTHLRNDLGQSLGRRFSRQGTNELHSSCVWGAAGYVIVGKAALRRAHEYWSNKHFVSETVICDVAQAFAGFMSSPPLIWQCNEGRLVSDSVQTLIEKSLMDRRARSLMKERFQELVESGMIDQVEIPDWVLRDCVV